MSPVRILWINPVHADAYDEELAEELNRNVSSDTQVDVVSFAGAGPLHLEYAAHELTVAPTLLSCVRWAEADGYDAAVIGCFYDPALRAARELTVRMAVTAPAEACLRTAATLGEKTAILVGRRKWIPEMHENVVRYGMVDKVASFRPLGLGVHDFQTDKERTYRLMHDQASRAVDEDGVDVIVLGCTIEFGFGSRLQEALGIPVLDAVLTPVAYAEHLAVLANRFGWRHAKVVGYQSPPADELSWLPSAERPGPLTRAPGASKASDQPTLQVG